MMAAESILLGLLATLVLGAYGYTFVLGRDIRKEIGKLWIRLTNHYEHRVLDIEQRLTHLEIRSEDRRE